MSNIVASKKQELAENLESKRQVIKNTVAKNASDDEFEMFMHLAKEYGLDPFQKEIFFWKQKGRVTTMTSRDGYLKIANQHPAYEGMDSNIIYPGDELEITKSDIKLKSDSISNMSKDPIGAYAVVYRSDRKIPTKIRVPFREYFKANNYKDNWKNYPSAMILKVAESMALKRAFSVSGLVSKEEMGQQEEIEVPEMEIDEQEYIDAKREGMQEEKPQLSERQQEIKQLIDNIDGGQKLVVEYIQGAEASGVDELGDEDYEILKQTIEDARKEQLMDGVEDNAGPVESERMITDSQRKKIFALINDKEKGREELQELVGIDSLSAEKCTYKQAEEFIEFLEQ